MFSRFQSKTFQTGSFVKRASEKKEQESNKFKNIRERESKPQNKIDTNVLPQLSGNRIKTADPIVSKYYSQPAPQSKVAKTSKFPAYVPPSGEGITITRVEEEGQTTALEKVESLIMDTEKIIFPAPEDEDGSTEMTIVPTRFYSDGEEDDGKVLIDWTKEEGNEKAEALADKPPATVPKQENLPIKTAKPRKLHSFEDEKTVNGPKKERVFKIKFNFTGNIAGADTREKLFNMYGTLAGKRIIEDGVLRCIIDDIDELEDEREQNITRSAFLGKLIRDSGSRSLSVIASQYYATGDFLRRVRLLVDCFSADPSLTVDKQFEFMFFGGVQTITACLKLSGGGIMLIDDNGQWHITRK